MSASGGLTSDPRTDAVGNCVSKIPLTDLRAQTPAGLQALYADVQDGQALIPGLKMSVGASTVQRWSPAYAAAGWTLYSADLTLDQGHPSGSMFYRNDTDGRMLCIGVKWHRKVHQLGFPALRPSKPELTSDCSAEEFAAVVLDVRSQIGLLSRSTRRSEPPSPPKRPRTQSATRPDSAWSGSPRPTRGWRSVAEHWHRVTAAPRHTDG